MLTSTLPPFSSPTPQVDSNPGQFGTGFNHNMLEGNYFFIAGGVVAGTMAILVGCAVWRMRLVRRRRMVLGLPPLAARASRNEAVDILKNKPVFYDAWTDFEVCVEEEKKYWDQMQALSAAQVLSLPIPPARQVKYDPYKNYFTSILELVSVKRLDKTLLQAVPEDRPPEYAKSELVASMMIAMPQPPRDSMTESWWLPELELGVYQGPWPKVRI
ncbi:hypothetical protein FS837_013029 [Tulasnella sp. UAMH 9824]|nr:hypothetical protein FS837_013029 [Tulasnella sp. UAMH 9824]